MNLTPYFASTASVLGGLEPSMDVSNFQRVCAQVDTHIGQLFDEAGQLPMYDMLRYFMGFGNPTHAPSSGTHGKRTRSALLLTVAELFGGASSGLDLAAAVELFHNFTLIHDDIEDHDEMRRGQETVWKVWGVNHGINSGDAQLVLVDRCLLRAATNDRDAAKAAALLNRHFLEVIEGQYLDFELTNKPLNDPAVDETAYLEMIRRKTAVLIGASAAAGGVAAGCGETDARSLYDYGESLGMAYQIVDDMVSVWEDVGTTGKLAYGDIMERKKTFPILYARDHGDTKKLCELYAQAGPMGPHTIHEVIALLDDCGARAATQTLAERYVVHARAAVSKLSLPAEERVQLDTLLRKVASSAGVVQCT